MITGLAVCGFRAQAAVEEVIVVFKTHFDIGYTDFATNVLERYRTTMMDDALRVVEENRSLPPEQQFAWTLPGWPMAKILEGSRDTDRRARIEQALTEGRFVVHALPFTTHTELLEREDLVRGLGYASRLARKFGLELPRDAKMTDVPSHSWILPTLLRHAGVDFLHLGCNAASSSPLVPQLFWWEGPDASRLLTMYTAESYGTGLVPPKDWPYRAWLALIHTGDNHGPPRPEEVQAVLAQAEEKLPGVKVRIGRLSDFADAILADAESTTIPVVRGDMPDTWIHGPLSDPQGASVARTLRPKLAMAELLETQLPGWGVAGGTRLEQRRAAGELSLLYGEHTWGGAYWWIYGSYRATYGPEWQAERAAGRFARIESSWEEHSDYIRKAARIAEPILEDQLRSLAAAVAQPGDRLLVFNPLPWPRHHGVTGAAVAGTGLSRAQPGLLIVGGGNAGAVFCDWSGDQIRCLAPVVPASGYVVLTHVPALVNSMHAPGLDREAARLDSGRYAATLNVRRGTIGSLQFAKEHRGPLTLPGIAECVDGESPFGFGQVLYERFDANQVRRFVDAYVKITADWATNELGKPCLPSATTAPYRAASPTEFKVTYSNSFVAAEATLQAAASADVPFDVTTRYLFYHDLPYFDLEVTLARKAAEPWPEAAWICLPFKVDSPQFRLGRLGSIVDPAREIVPGSNRHLLALETGLAVYGTDGQGFGVCPMDSPLVSLSEPGGWKYSTNFVPERATVFINLFNNQWTTNFRLWTEGTWTSRVRIWAFRDFDPVESLQRPSLEARYPLQMICASGPGGTVPTSGAGLELKVRAPNSPGKPDAAVDRWCRNAVVTAFGPNPDGAGTILRLWETAGETGEREVHLPPGWRPESVQPVDLRGRPSGPAIVVSEGMFVVSLRAFAPSSFLIPAGQGG